MICYKDMTFCYSDCANEKCYRFFGEKQNNEAAAWWGSDDAPVAFSDFSEKCPDYKKSN